VLAVSGGIAATGALVAFALGRERFGRALGDGALALLLGAIWKRLEGIAAVTAAQR
jgi:hypothetical protein